METSNKLPPAAKAKRGDQHHEFCSAVLGLSDEALAHLESGQVEQPFPHLMVVNGQDIYLEGTIIIPLEGDESLTFESYGQLSLSAVNDIQRRRHEGEECYPWSPS